MAPISADSKKTHKKHKGKSCCKACQKGGECKGKKKKLRAKQIQTQKQVIHVHGGGGRATHPPMAQHHYHPAPYHSGVAYQHHQNLPPGPDHHPPHRNPPLHGSHTNVRHLGEVNVRPDVPVGAPASTSTVAGPVQAVVNNSQVGSSLQDAVSRSVSQSFMEPYSTPPSVSDPDLFSNVSQADNAFDVWMGLSDQTRGIPSSVKKAPQTPIIDYGDIYRDSSFNMSSENPHIRTKKKDHVTFETSLTRPDYIAPTSGAQFTKPKASQVHVEKAPPNVTIRPPWKPSGITPTKSKVPATKPSGTERRQTKIPGWKR